jgi:hypothetical protein
MLFLTYGGSAKPTDFADSYYHSLIEVPSLKEAEEDAWEQACDNFDGEYDEEEDDWGDLVSSAAYLSVIPYDPTNPDHAAMEGTFSVPRPEHARQVAKNAILELRLNVRNAAVKYERAYNKYAETLKETETLQQRAKEELIAALTAKFKKKLAK